VRSPQIPVIFLLWFAKHHLFSYQDGSKVRSEGLRTHAAFVNAREYTWKYVKMGYGDLSLEYDADGVIAETLADASIHEKKIPKNSSNSRESIL
jgi:hypothetical protein